MVRSSASSASLHCCTNLRVLMSSVTVPSSPVNSSGKLLCSSSSGWISTAFNCFFGVTAAMRVKALVLLNKVPVCDSGTSEDTEEEKKYGLDFLLSKVKTQFKPSLNRPGNVQLHFTDAGVQLCQVVTCFNISNDSRLFQNVYIWCVWQNVKSTRADSVRRIKAVINY